MDHKKERAFKSGLHIFILNPLRIYGKNHFKNLVIFSTIFGKGIDLDNIILILIFLFLFIESRKNTV